MARTSFFFCCLLLLTLCVNISTATSSWCVARKDSDVSDLERYVDSTCTMDPQGCRIIKPGPIGFCYDKTSNPTIQTRIQASYLFNRVYVDMGLCHDLAEVLVDRYPSKDIIGNISMGFLCFPPRDVSTESLQI